VTTASKTTGVILAGGFGTRLHSLLPDRPKVLAEVNGRPFVTIVLDQLAAAGIEQIVVCTGHLGDQVQKTLGSDYRGIPLLYSQEKKPLGTGGAVRQAFDQYDADAFLVLNGDSYVDASLSAFRSWHEDGGRPGSLLLTWVEDCARFGTVETAEDGRVCGFFEKRNLACPGWINAGIYLLSREVLEALPAATPFSVEREFFPSLLERGLGGYRVRAPFIDIGTPQSLASAEAFFARIGRCARRRFVVLDRDGTLIHERNYLSSPQQVELIPRAAEALVQMREMGLGIVMITNQSGIGRGFFDMPQVDEVHTCMRDLLAREGASVDAVYVCPHTPDDNCACRKPQPGLLLRASAEFGFVPAESFMIGDKACDIEAGRSCGATTFLVRSGYGRQHLDNGWAKPDFVINDLTEAVECIRAILKSSSMQLETKGLIPQADERLRRHLVGSFTTKRRVLEDCEESILAAAGAISGSMVAGGKLLLCGNGGSAADCQHIAGEMVSVLNQSFLRPGLAAIAMTTDSSILTASANDFGYEGVFERQVQALGKPGDVVLGISTSGNSENVFRALSYASRHGMRSICLTGASGGRIAKTSEISICVPSVNVQHIQESHITIGHILCDLVERTLFQDERQLTNHA
jgi:histidinol-phosphate phosphatase family protein